MLKEIGSEFNIALKTNEKYLKSESNINEDYQDYVYTRTGGEAIGFVLDDIKVNTKIAILPTYICESMSEPFLSRGYSIEYFNIDRNFNPDLSQIKTALTKNPDIILFIDWFGMDKNKEVISLVKSNYEDMVILEDRTHNFFDDYKKTDADFTIASLRKWIAIPDGAIAISHKGKFKNMIKFFDSNYFVDSRKKAMLLKTEYLNTGNESLKSEYMELFAKAENFIEGENKLNGISDYSLSLINQMDFDTVKIKRRDNFNALYKLIDKTKVKLVIDEIASANKCPFCFPILVESKRDELRKWLVGKKIYCPVLWPLPEEIYLNYEVPAYISDNILMIPCDQRYSTDDMKYIVEKIDAFFEEK